MNPQLATKRAYNSSRRQAQAVQTRRQIVEAARTLFIVRGYAGATIDAIAHQAGVAVETVYATFGSKAAILSRLIEVSLVGDGQPVPLLERPGPRAALQEEDQYHQIELFAEGMVKIMSRMAPLFDIMRGASKTEPDIAEMFQKLLKDRVKGLGVFVQALAKNGPLLKGLSTVEATETVWALTSGEVFILLVKDRGWSPEKYGRWLAKTLTRVLLP